MTRSEFVRGLAGDDDSKAGHVGVAAVYESGGDGSVQGTQIGEVVLGNRQRRCGLAPITHARQPEALAEERRLLYVAMTRAQRELRLTWAQLRTFGTNEVARQPSPYLRQVLDATGRLTHAASPVGDRAGPRRVADSRARLAATGSDPAASADREVLDALRTWRAREARAAGVAPGVVLADRTLAAVAARRPADVDQLDLLPGLGPLKARRYGATLIELVAQHRNDEQES